jgi:hypothetical protein
VRTQSPRAPDQSRGRRAAPPLDRVLEQDGGRAIRETREATGVGRYSQGKRSLRRGGSVGSNATPPDDPLRGDAPAQRHPASPERVRESALDADRSVLGTRAVDSGARARDGSPSRRAARPPRRRQGPLPRTGRTVNGTGHGAPSAAAWCQATRRAHGVVPGESWGTLPTDWRKAWVRKRCDARVPRPRSSLTHAP